MREIKLYVDTPEKPIDAYVFTEGLTERQINNCYNRASNRAANGDDYDVALIEEFGKAQARKSKRDFLRDKQAEEAVRQILRDAKPPTPMPTEKEAKRYKGDY